MLRLICSVVVMLIVLAGCAAPVALAHDYSAPYFYMAGVYESDPKAYPPASGEEIGWLLKQIVDDDKSVRAVAAGALGQTRDPRAAEPLLKALRDKAMFVRMNAAMGFVHVKDKRAIEPLKVMLSNPQDAYAAMAAGYALAAQGDEGIAALVSAIEKMPSHSGAGDSLGDVSQFILVAKGLDAIDWAVDKIRAGDRRLSKAAVSVLTDLNQSDSQVRQRLDRALADPAVGEALLKLALGAPSDQAYCAGVMIMDSKNEELIDKLRNAAQNATGDKRKYLSDLMMRTQMRDREGVETPRPVLDEKTIVSLVAKVKKAEKDREAALEGQVSDEPYDAASELGWSDNPKAIQALISLLQDKNISIAGAAVQGLGRSSSPAAVQALMKLAKDPKSKLQWEAKAALVDMRSIDLIDFYVSLLREQGSSAPAIFSFLSETKSPKAIKALIEMLSNPELRLQAATALQRTGDPAAIGPLANVLAGAEPDESRRGIVPALVSFGQAAVNKVIPKLSDQNASARRAAADFFRQVKSPKAVQPLVKLLSDKNTDVRLAAIRALVAQGDESIGPKLVSLLDDPNKMVRLEAARAMALDPKPEYAQSLAPLLKDKDKSVRACAGVALAQLGDKRGAAAVIYVLNPSPDDEESYGMGLFLPAVRAAGVLKEKRAVTPILGMLGGDVNLSVFEASPEAALEASRDAKGDALRAITGQDFGRAYYRWIAYWVGQGNSFSLFGEDQ